MGRVIAVQRLEQPDGGDLLEVLERNPLAAIEAPRDRVGKRQVVADQAFAGPRIAVVGVGAEICCVTLAAFMASASAARGPGDSSRDIPQRLASTSRG